jgi:hypothetical protein
MTRTGYYLIRAALMRLCSFNREGQEDEEGDDDEDWILSYKSSSHETVPLTRKDRRTRKGTMTRTGYYKSSSHETVPLTGKDRKTRKGTMMRTGYYLIRAALMRLFL